LSLMPDVMKQEHHDHYLTSTSPLQT